MEKKQISKEEWEKLYWEKVEKPTLLIGLIPSTIFSIFSIIVFINLMHNSEFGVTCVMFSAVYFLFVVLIFGFAGGADFRDKYGECPE